MRYITRPGTVFLLLAALPAGSGTAKPQTGVDNQEAQPYRISLDLNLVVLPTTVLDKKGGFATGLSERDFEIYEDGVRQAVRLFRNEDIPVTVGLVVDHSGSMRNKLSEVIAAAHTFVKLSNPQDQMFVVNFSDKVSLGLPASIPFSDRAEELQLALERVPAAGQTALYDAVATGLDRLKAGDREKKVLVVVSDGGDTASVLDKASMLKRAAESNAVIYTVGIFDPEDPDKNPELLRKLARMTGGEAYFPAKIEDAVTVCERIASDIRHQYTIGYVSGRTAKRGEYRSIRVVARSAGKNLVARTRAGFVANSGTE